MANRSQREPIRPRLGMDALLAPLNSTGGRGIGVAATPTNALGRLQSDSVIAPGSSRSKSAEMWANFLPAFGNLIKVATDKMDKEQAKADREAERARIRAENEAERARDRAEAELKARQDAVDRLAGTALGNRILSEVSEKSRLGEMTAAEAQEYITSQYASTGSNTAMRAAEPFALKAIGIAEENHRNRILETQANEFLAVTRQGFHDLHEGYDPDRYDDYVIQRNALYESRHTLGLKGTDIDAIEMESLSAQAKKFATSDPMKAQRLLELAERVRPDGTPSLAASAKDGYIALEKLRGEVANTILVEAERERAEADRTRRETTGDNYFSAIRELSEKQTPDEVKQWEAANIAGKPDAELKERFGSHAGDVLNTVEARKSGRIAANAEAMAEWQLRLQAGETDWEEAKRDPRTSDVQKNLIFSIMKQQEQDVRKGYIPDSQLSVRLLADLEKEWPQSVYRTPWTGTELSEPGKPPSLRVEGSFYQGELFKRLRKLEPVEDVNESNRRKLEVVQEVKDDILSGRLRFGDNMGALKDAAPELKFSEKIKDGVPLTATDYTALGKLYSEGGRNKVLASAGVDIFSLPTQDQLRISGEAQQHRAKLDALKANTFLSRFFRPFTPEEEQADLRAELNLIRAAGAVAEDGWEAERLLILGEDVPEVPAEERPEEALEEGVKRLTQWHTAIGEMELSGLMRDSEVILGEREGNE